MSKSTGAGKTEIEPESAGTQALNRGRVAIVTGAGRGIGRAMTLGLAQAGIRVVATSARERAEIDAVAAEAGTDMVLAVLADVTREADVQRVVASTLERFGHLDILVNNAGRGMRYISESFMTAPARFWEVEPETWRMVIDTNVNGPFLMARAATPHMVRAGWGRIVSRAPARCLVLETVCSCREITLVRAEVSGTINPREISKRKGGSRQNLQERQFIS